MIGVVLFAWLAYLCLWFWFTFVDVARESMARSLR